MKDLFYEDGHLSDYAFACLIQDEELDELSRLEIAEHLSYCDRCVAAYAARLADDSLLCDPPEPVAPGVLRRLRERARRIFCSRYTSAVVAASFAIVFWNIGVFNFDLEGNSKFFTQVSGGITGISAQADKVSNDLTETLRALFGNLSFERGNHDYEKK